MKASNINTHPDKLRELSQHSEIYIRRLIAKNPSTPLDALQYLAEHHAYENNNNFDWTVIINLVCNPSMQKSMLEELAKRVLVIISDGALISQFKVALFCAKNSPSNFEEYHKLQPYARFELAERINNPDFVMRAIMNECHPFIRETWMKNPNLPDKYKALI